MSINTALSDGVVIAKRNLIKVKRVPDLLVWTAISPIMFVLLFAYVFGSSISIPGTTYREYLIAGVFTQTIIFGSSFTGIGMAEDMTKGIVDRFRSLPMSRVAVLFGRTATDILFNVISILIMTITGLVVGWRIRTSFFEAIWGFMLLLALAYAMSWIMAYVGLKIPKVEVINNASFIVIFPMTFIANTFVRADLLPGPLRTFAEWNPVSAASQAAREAFGNTGSLPASDAWSIQNPFAYTLICVGVILLIFLPLAIREYKKATTQ